MDSDYSCYHFSINMPIGDGQNDVPALLRRVAETIESMGDIEPLHLTMNVEVNDEGLLPVATFYYDRPTLRLVD